MCLGAEFVVKELGREQASSVLLFLWSLGDGLHSSCCAAGNCLPLCIFSLSAATQTVALLFLLQVNGRTESGVKTLRGTEKSK